MSDLRKAAQQALEALDNIDKEFKKHGRQHWPEAVKARNAAPALRAALAEPDRKPLTEEQVERAYQEIWRDSPDDFGPTAGDWIEAGIRYAERVHGIK